MQFATQKARGIDSIGKLHSVPTWIGRPENFYVLPYNMPPTYRMPIFARPCPERPRHGFVDSREVTTLQELLDLYVEAKLADPKAEVVTMSKLSGKCSAIATDAGVTWGLGNDGVTAGGAVLWDIPCPNAGLTSQIVKHNPKLQGDISHLYMEIVEHNDRPIIVQLRDGPKITSASGNYIPEKDYRVTNVILGDPTSTDLLKWEKLIAEAPKGSVLVLPGTGLSSHYAVHGITHKLAVLTGKSKDLLETDKADNGTPIVRPRVRVGDVLQPENGQPKPLRAVDYKTMRLMLRKRMPFKMAEAAPFAVSVLHAMPTWGRDRHLLALRIHGAMSMFRLLTAGCMGEARHAGHKRYQVMEAMRNLKLDWTELGGSSANSPPGSRSSVFARALEMPFDRVVKLADQARVLLSGHWGHVNEEDNQTKYDPNGKIILEDPMAPFRGDCGYGGPKWRRSAEVALCLGLALQEFRKKPSEATWLEVLKLYNMGVNCAHNGGRVLDKFCDWSSIDRCAKVPQFGFISSMTFNTLLLVKSTQEAKKPKGKAKLDIPEPLVRPESTVVGKRPADMTISESAHTLAANDDSLSNEGAA